MFVRALSCLAILATACGDGGGDDAPDGAVPTDPLEFEPGDALQMRANGITHFVLVPRGYDATHQTPAQVYVYLHGCGGASSGDVYAASNIDADWIGLAPGGAEGQCWDNQSASAEIVMDAIAELKTHFNIDRRRVHIGGYSSGGDLSYYTALRNASSFAGILSYNSIPSYSAKGLQDGITAASWKLNIVHLSQTEDGVYAIADVRARFQTLRDAGFPVTHIERPGAHYDDNTTQYRNTLVYPHLEDGWRAP
ncbi:MAG: hypothetical protein ACAI38_21730 [Myxococcota bacterium]